MLPLTKLISAVGGGYRREKTAQTDSDLAEWPTEIVCDLTCRRIASVREYC